jgi:antitoxin VapB
MGDNRQFMRLMGSMPWLKSAEREHHRTKIFKSGNSLALRIPAGTALKAGMEMDLTIENGLFLSYDPVDAPKRKFNVAKVAGSARNLNYVEPEHRLFEARTSSADDTQHEG